MEQRLGSNWHPLVLLGIETLARPARSPLEDSKRDGPDSILILDFWSPPV